MSAQVALLTALALGFSCHFTTLLLHPPQPRIPSTISLLSYLLQSIPPCCRCSLPLYYSEPASNPITHPFLCVTDNALNHGRALLPRRLRRACPLCSAGLEPTASAGRKGHPCRPCSRSHSSLMPIPFSTTWRTSRRSTHRTCPPSSTTARLFSLGLSPNS